MNKWELFLACMVLLSCLSQLILKKASQQEYKNKINYFLNERVIFAYLIYFLITLVNARIIYGHLEMNQIGIVEAIGYIFVPLLSAIILHEKISKQQIIGIALITAGIMVYHL